VYRTPNTADPVLFGDVFSSDWLHDVVIHQDAVGLAPVNLRGGQAGYVPMVPGAPFKTNKDFMLAHGRACRAVLLSDDCEIETCLVRKEGKSRLVFAAVAPWPDDPEQARKALERTTFRRHPLRPAEGFEGGVVNLVRLFAVSGRALDVSGRVVSLETDARAALEQRWAAFATRRGPLAAADNATKLAHLLDADGDADKLELLHRGDALPGKAAQDVALAVQRALTQGWRTEGEVMQAIAFAHEQRGTGQAEAAALEAELRALADMAVAAADEISGRAEDALGDA
jgi:hypothetical protein